MSDIVDAVPIDKYFELFKPGMGGEGGFIRVAMNFVTDLNELQNEEGEFGPIGPLLPKGCNMRVVAWLLWVALPFAGTDVMRRRALRDY